jgi:hypothetical protein
MERLGTIVVGVLMVTVVTIIAIVATGSGSSAEPVDDAMGVIPADAETVIFSDLARERERLGFGDLTSESSESEFDDYLSAAVDEPWVGSALGSYAVPMREWGWSFVDVEWEASYYTDENYATAYRLRDDLDPGVVESSFADRGYERSEVAGYPAFSLDLDDAAEDEPPIPELFEVVLLPDQHLLLAGPDAELLVDTATGDAESVADSGAAAELVGAVDAPEYLALSMDCVDPMRLMGRLPSPEAVEALESSLAETPGSSDLRRPVGHLAAVTSATDEPAAEAVVAYADSADAEADVEPRQAFLDDAASPINNVPYAELLDPAAEGDGAFVRYDFAEDDALGMLPQMIQTFDLPWAYCPVSS